MSPRNRALAALIGAATIWGLSPLFYKQLTPVPPMEVLAHRTIWSLVLFSAILVLRGRLHEVPLCLRAAPLRLWLAASLISVNWFGFIWAVQVGRAMEASLGYYFFPLVTVVLGLVFMGDRLRPAQWFAVGLATCAVVVLTIGLGALPFVPLTLAITFGLYGLLKKRFPAEAMVSVTGEVLVLAPLAVIWLAGVHLAGWVGPTGRSGAVFGTDLWLSFLLVCSSFFTAVPLMLFSYGSHHLRLPTVGLTQYLNPTLQFLCAVWVFGEAFTPWHAIAFAMIWTGLAVYSRDALLASRRSSNASSTSSTAVIPASSDGPAKPSRTM